MSFAVTDPTPATPVRTDAAWLDAHWMPYTGNRQFKADPRLIVAAQGAYFTSHDGRQIFDGLSGLWCSGLGHGRTEITEVAVDEQTGEIRTADGDSIPAQYVLTEDAISPDGVVVARATFNWSLKLQEA